MLFRSGEEINFSVVIERFFEFNPRPTFFDSRKLSVKLARVDVSAGSDEYIRGTFIEFIEEVEETGAGVGVLA